jgi:SAM-dependent methyltransferase
MEWYEYAVGGMWDEMGELQRDFLIGQGLRPEHYLLDVGCGSLRGGVKLLPYLEPGHYYGIDISADLLGAAELVIDRHGLRDRRPTLMQTDTFAVEPLGRSFDFAIAQSVFTHIPLNSIIMAVMRVERVLAPGGRFFATFLNNPQGKFNLEPLQPNLQAQVVGPRFQSFFDRDPYHYDVATFEWICAGTSLRVEYFGEWNHPRDQHMLIFHKDQPAAR